MYCFGTKHSDELPITISGQDDITFTFEIELRRTGLIEAYTELYVEGEDGIHTVALRVRGIGRAAGGK